MKLINTETGQEVKEGDTVTNFRGETHIVDYVEEPMNERSSGRVYVKNGYSSTGFYPSVFRSLVWHKD